MRQTQKMPMISVNIPLLASLNNPTGRGPVMRSVLKRFEDKYIPEPNSGCWLWDAYVNPFGYGMMRVGPRMELSHRVSYALFVDEIPECILICHKCDVPGCVNPEHLFSGTDADNNADMIAKGRSNPAHIGMCHSLAKLNDNDVMEIRTKLTFSGLTNIEISEIYNVSPSTISRVIRGQSWSHLPMGRC